MPAKIERCVGKLVTTVGAATDLGVNNITIFAVTIIPAAAQCTVTLKDGSGGTVTLKVGAAANGGSVTFYPPGGEKMSDPYYEITGVGAEAVVHYKVNS